MVKKRFDKEYFEKMDIKLRALKRMYERSMGKMKGLGE